MAYILTNIGEEWWTENNINGFSITVGVYNSSDAISDTDDYAGDGSVFSTEPTNTEYSKEGDTITTYQDGNGDFGFKNDTELVFDFSDQTTSEEVDSYFVLATFTSDTVAGDGSNTQHLVATGALEQSRDIGSIDTLNISAGGVSATLD